MIKRKLFGVDVACGRCNRIFKSHARNSKLVCSHCGCRGYLDNYNFVTSDDRLMCPYCNSWGQKPTELLRRGCTSCGRRIREVSELFHHA